MVTFSVGDDGSSGGHSINNSSISGSSGDSSTGSHSSSSACSSVRSIGRDDSRCSSNSSRGNGSCHSNSAMHCLPGS